MRVSRKDAVRVAGLIANMTGASRSEKVRLKREAVDSSRGIERICLGPGVAYFTPNGCDEVKIGHVDSTTITIKSAHTCES